MFNSLNGVQMDIFVVSFFFFFFFFLFFVLFCFVLNDYRIFLVVYYISDHCLVSVTWEKCLSAQFWQQ